MELCGYKLFAAYVRHYFTCSIKPADDPEWENTGVLAGSTAFAVSGLASSLLGFYLGSKANRLLQHFFSNKEIKAGNRLFARYGNLAVVYLLKDEMQVILQVRPLSIRKKEEAVLPQEVFTLAAYFCAKAVFHERVTSLVADG